MIIDLTQILGSAAQPLNLIDNAFDNTSNLGSNGGTGTQDILCLNILQYLY